MKRRVRTSLAVGLGASLSLAAVAAVVFAQEQPNSASAQTELALPDLHPGEGWQERAPQTSTKTSVRGRTWSDPAAGCHLALFALPVSDAVGIEPTRASLIAILANANLAVTETGVGPMTIAGDGVYGIAKLRLAAEPVRSISLTACYWNDREPKRCQAICQRTLQAQAPVAP